MLARFRSIRFGILILLVFGDSALAVPAQVLLLRHGEKPPVGTELSERGWARAKALPKLFKTRHEFQIHGLPVALYAMSRIKKDRSVRAAETMKYVAENLNLPIQTKFSRTAYEALVEEVLRKPEYSGRLVVICWEHFFLRKIAKAFGVKHPPKYHGRNYDRAWLISFGRQKHPQLIDLPQRLLEGDSKK